MNAIANYQRWDVSFDEAFYLQTNPDVAAAVAAGVIPSGAVHFVNFGVKERRPGKQGQLYNEATYLAENPDVAAAVAAGAFASGFEHLALFGRQEGRTFSPYFDEEWYRKRYPDVDTAIQAGAFASAFDHYLAFGRDRSERRSTSPVNEFLYLRSNSDVAAAVDSNIIFSGSQHYQQQGQREKRPVYLTGTSGNDDLNAGPNGDTLIGVAVGVEQGVISSVSVGYRAIYETVGLLEVDTLTGGIGPDTFVLGAIAPSGGVSTEAILSNSTIAGSGGPVALYNNGLGEQDYAEIRNFDPAQDRILIAPDLTDLTFESRGNDTVLVSTWFDFGRGVRTRPEVFAIVKDAIPEQVQPRVFPSSPVF
jgi:hypothetical protein